jgi:hypothetical protein
MHPVQINAARLFQWLYIAVDCLLPLVDHVFAYKLQSVRFRFYTSLKSFKWPHTQPLATPVNLRLVRAPIRTYHLGMLHGIVALLLNLQTTIPLLGLVSNSASMVQGTQSPLATRHKQSTHQCLTSGLLCKGQLPFGTVMCMQRGVPHSRWPRKAACSHARSGTTAALDDGSLDRRPRSAPHKAGAAHEYPHHTPLAASQACTRHQGTPTIGTPSCCMSSATIVLR